MDEAGNFRADNFERLRPEEASGGDMIATTSGRGAETQWQRERSWSQRVSRLICSTPHVVLGILCRTPLTSRDGNAEASGRTLCLLCSSASCMRPDAVHSRRVTGL